MGKCIIIYRFVGLAHETIDYLHLSLVIIFNKGFSFKIIYFTWISVACRKKSTTDYVTVAMFNKKIIYNKIFVII